MSESPNTPRLSVIGGRPVRPDGVDKVTGRALFGADFAVAGQLCGRVLRSAHAHAKIVSIDTRKARALAGVKAVVTGALFGILFGSNREVRLRRIMAEQFTDMEVLTAAFGGEQGSTLITDRNAAALDVLREQIGKGRRKIAIFYGAAHMDDFDQKLQRDFKLQPREAVWLEAWDLRDPAGRN